MPLPTEPVAEPDIAAAVRAAREIERERARARIFRAHAYAAEVFRRRAERRAARARDGREVEEEHEDSLSEVSLDAPTIPFGNRTLEQDLARLDDFLDASPSD